MLCAAKHFDYIVHQCRSKPEVIDLYRTVVFDARIQLRVKGVGAWPQHILACTAYASYDKLLNPAQVRI